jgi:AcrR family transcriptional regulator
MNKPKRSSGRPSNDERREIDSPTILKAALELTKTTALQDISIAAVARSMDITPALIHYYIGGRDWLISGVMNLFYRELITTWPEPSDDWENGLLDASKHIYEHFLDYGGIAAYASSNNRFRVFQLEGTDQPDYGLQLLENFSARVRAAGLSGERTGIYAHLMMNFITNTAHATSRHLFPSEYRVFLEEKTKTLNKDEFPNIFFAMHSPLNLDGNVAFQEACNLFLLGISTEAAAAQT